LKVKFWKCSGLAFKQDINLGQDSVFSLLFLAMSSGVKGWARNTE
jgi:hypothetical protein